MPSPSATADPRWRTVARNRGDIPSPLPRVHVTEPISQPEAARLVIAASGRMARYDQPGFELQLYEQLAGRLVAHGIATIRFDMADEKPRSATSSPQRQAARTERLCAVIREELSGARSSPVVFLGASLGAHSVLDVLGRVTSARVKAAILIGCVAEAPVTLLAPLGSLTFLYGERDLVAYSDEGQQLGEAIPPDRYGPATADNMIVLPRTRVAVEILSGVGHLLQRPRADAPDDSIIDLLTECVVQAASGTEKSP